MQVLTEEPVGRYQYALARDARGRWWLWRSDRGRAAKYPLDYDARHERLFLSERDQERLGTEGIVALERMVRRVIPREPVAPRRRKR